MRFTISIFLIILISYVQTSFAQKYSPILITFSPIIEEEQLVLHKRYVLKDNDTLSIENLRFYISGIQLFNNNNLVWKEKNSFHLIDQEDTNSKIISLTVNKNILYNKVSFNLGIDSLTNVSGAYGGDLDPTKGMYWTWQSGYINLKMEGISSLCGTNNHEFQLHLGGYQAPYNSLQYITLSIDNPKKINILLDMSEVMKSIHLKKEHHIMSPSDSAVKHSNTIANCFKIASP